jgi:hypothetical protein
MLIDKQDGDFFVGVDFQTLHEVQAIQIEWNRCLALLIFRKAAA